MKNQRQARILELINKFDLHTQEEITTMLQNEGFRVTQATVSRDLRDLKLTKNLASTGKYRYSSHQGSGGMGMVKLNNAMLESIVSVKYSMNNVVIKTFPGLAQAVASNVDSLSLDAILGCVAGDDTIIIVTVDENSAEDISDKIKELLRTY